MNKALEIIKRREAALEVVPSESRELVRDLLATMNDAGITIDITTLKYEKKDKE